MIIMYIFIIFSLQVRLLCVRLSEQLKDEISNEFAEQVGLCLLRNSLLLFHIPFLTFICSLKTIQFEAITAIQFSEVLYFQIRIVKQLQRKAFI